MFTMRDFSRIKKGIKGLEIDNLFSPERNELAYEMSRLGSPARGTCGEKFVALHLRRMKYNVKRYGNIHPFDLLVNNSIKCEVKVATFCRYGKSFLYAFQKIKPELFDILFLVFVTPDGLVIKWTEQKYVDMYTKDKKRQKDGYYMYFDSSCDNVNMAYNDSMDDFVKFYPVSLKNEPLTNR